MLCTVNLWLLYQHVRQCIFQSAFDDAASHCAQNLKKKKHCSKPTYCIHSCERLVGGLVLLLLLVGLTSLLLLLLLLLLVSDVLEESCPSLSVTMLRRRLVPF